MGPTPSPGEETMNNWIGGVAMVGVIIALWDKIKFVYTRLSSILIVTAKVEGDAANGFLILVNREFRRSLYGPQTFGSRFRYLKPLNRYAEIGYERLYSEEPTVYWKGHRPIIIQQTMNGERNVDSGPKEKSLTIRFLRGTWDIDKLVIHSIEAYNRTTSTSMELARKSYRRFFIHRFTGSGKKATSTKDSAISGGNGYGNTILADSGVRFLRWKIEDIGLEPPKNHSAVDGLAFPGNIQEFVRELKQWQESRDWYLEREIPWTRGWLLHGKPGNGKTSLVRALGIDMDMPIFSFDLSSMTNSEFISSWNEAKKFAPCIILMEDIDAVFDHRQNIVGEDGGGLTFDCLLNCLNGVEDNNGIFLVITTNHLEKVDDAIASNVEEGQMASRPGRVDRVFELLPPNEDCRRKIASRILSDWPNTVEAMVVKGEGDSAAQFQERCTEKALSLFWRQGQGQESRTPLKWVG
jgi:hypothetical protein